METRQAAILFAAVPMRIFSRDRMSAERRLAVVDLRVV
jgi:hypothetical protein